MEIKIPKEVRAHKETIFFGLSARQFICAVLAVAVAVGVLPYQAPCRPGDGKLGLHRGGGSRGRHRLFPVQRPDL